MKRFEVAAVVVEVLAGLCRPEGFPKPDDAPLAMPIELIGDDANGLEEVAGAPAAPDANGFEEAGFDPIAPDANGFEKVVPGLGNGEPEVDPLAWSVVSPSGLKGFADELKVGAASAGLVWVNSVDPSVGLATVA